MSVSLTDECEAAGLDPKEVQRIANGLSRYARQAEKLGLTIFGGGSGSGSLRFFDDPDKGALIVAWLDGMYDGGDGAEESHQDGLTRGER